MDMCISHLDEAQGLTVEMMRAHLTKAGWISDMENDAARYRQEIWRHPTSKIRIFGDRFDGSERIGSMELSHAIGMLADEEPGSAQELLRVINPRMRRGMPSLEAWKTHGGDNGFWLGIWDVTREQAGEFSWFAQRPIITTLRRFGEFWDWGIRGAGFHHEDGKPEKAWSFWPCDQYGNKVRWPTDSNGAML